MQKGIYVFSTKDVSGQALPSLAGSNEQEDVESPQSDVHIVISIPSNMHIKVRY